MTDSEVFFSSKSMFITLTNVCNAFCKKCITRYSKNRNSFIPDNIYNHIKQLLIEHNYGGCINCGTGETLICEKLPDFLLSILEKTNSNFRILSNGLKLSSDLPDFYFDKRITWGITLDGFFNKELENLQTGIDIEIVKKNIVENCKKGRNENLYLNYTLHNGNFASLKSYIDFAFQNNIPDLYCTELKIYKGFEELDKYRLSKEQRNELEVLENYAKGLNFRRVYFGTAKSKKVSDKCYLNKNIAPIIDLDGSVSFCYGQEDKIVGNIMDDNIFEKWNKVKRILMNNQENNWCRNCSSRISSNQYIVASNRLYPYMNKK